MSVVIRNKEWRRAVVFGLGASGSAAAGFLLDHEVAVLGVDRRSKEELELGELWGEPGFDTHLGQEPAEVPPDTDAIVVSPGVPMDRPLLRDARDRDVPVLAEVELAFSFLNGPLVGITGSNGKSTTTAMTGALLRASGIAVEVCGNIGVPLISRVRGPEGRVFVVELSSFQLEGVADLRPRAAALLNLSPDHIDRHGSNEEYADSKLRLFARQLQSDCAVLNADDPWLRDLGVTTRARKRFFSRLRKVKDGCYLDGDRIVEVGPGEKESKLFRTSDMSQPGAHNLENAMAAALLARALGASASAFGPALSQFEGLAHRMETVAILDGVRWIDDSKGTNVGAVLKSLEGFEDQTVHLILGGRAKGEDFSALGPLVERKARMVYLIGEAGPQLRRQLDITRSVLDAGDLENAVRSAAREVASGETVLLSPACASFDQYRSFRERGNHFNELVKRLAERAEGVDG